MKPWKALSALFCLAASAAPLLAQEEVNPVEAKLRESLRAVMIQQRDTEAERARLDAELAALKIQSEAQAKDLAGKLDTAIKRADEDKAAAGKEIATRKEQLADAAAREKALRENLDQWRASHAQVSELARKTEAERATLKSETLALRRLVETRERQNLALYRTGREVLKRYEDYGLGRALLAREPFTGLSKVKLEEQVQDYRDQLSDGLVKTDGTDNDSAATGATPPRKNSPRPQP